MTWRRWKSSARKPTSSWPSRWARTTTSVPCLTKALGSDRAAGLIEDILEAGEGGSGIDALNWLDPHTVAELIGDEHRRSSPPSWCTWSATARRRTGALTDRLRNDVMRIATFGGVQPAALSELTDVLNSVLAGQGASAARWAA